MPKKKKDKLNLVWTSGATGHWYVTLESGLVLWCSLVLFSKRYQLLVHNGIRTVKRSWDFKSPSSAKRAARKFLKNALGEIVSERKREVSLLRDMIESL